MTAALIARLADEGRWIEGPLDPRRLMAGTTVVLVDRLWVHGRRSEADVALFAAGWQQFGAQWWRKGEALARIVSLADGLMVLAGPHTDRAWLTCEAPPEWRAELGRRIDLTPARAATVPSTDAPGGASPLGGVE
jgi:hypothetical protein